MPPRESDIKGMDIKGMGDRFGLRVCECGQVGVTIGEEQPFLLNRCGRDSRRNMRGGCPFQTVHVEVVGVEERF